MKHIFVKQVVDSLNQSHVNFVDKVYDGNLPKAINDTIIKMVKENTYKKYYADFEVLRKAAIELDSKGYLGN